MPNAKSRASLPSLGRLSRGQIKFCFFFQMKCGVQQTTKIYKTKRSKFSACINLLLWMITKSLGETWSKDFFVATGT